jgi:hypothetical protein
MSKAIAETGKTPTRYPSQDSNKGSVALSGGDIKKQIIKVIRKYENNLGGADMPLN